MKRGDVVTVAAGSGFGGKPRPGLIIQADEFDQSKTIVLALFTTQLTDIPLARLRFERSETNGLHSASDLMTDILITVRRNRIGNVVGGLSSADMTRVDRALLVFLGLAG